MQKQMAKLAFIETKKVNGALHLLLMSNFNESSPPLFRNDFGQNVLVF